VDEYAGYMACMGGKKDACWLLVGKTQRKHMMEGVCMGGRRILKGYSNNRIREYGLGSSGSEWGQCCAVGFHKL